MKFIFSLVLVASFVLPVTTFAAGTTAMDPDWCEKGALAHYSFARQTPKTDFGTIFDKCVDQLVKKAEKARDCPSNCQAPSIIAEANKIKVLIANSGETIDYKTFSRMRILMSTTVARHVSSR